MPRKPLDCRSAVRQLSAFPSVWRRTRTANASHCPFILHVFLRKTEQYKRQCCSPISSGFGTVSSWRDAVPHPDRCAAPVPRQDLAALHSQSACSRSTGGALPHTPKIVRIFAWFFSVFCVPNPYFSEIYVPNLYFLCHLRTKNVAT